MLSFQSQFRTEPKVQPSAAVAEEAKDAVKSEQNGKGGEKRKAQFPQLFSPNAAKKVGIKQPYFQSFIKRCHML